MDCHKHKKRSDFKIFLICSASLYSRQDQPYLAVPLLSGQLKKAGFSTYCKDYDLEYGYDSLSDELLDESYKKIKSNFKKFTPEFYYKAKESGKYSEFQLNSFIYKIKTYKQYMKNDYVEKLYKELKSIAPEKKIYPLLFPTIYSFHSVPYIYSNKDFSFNFSFIKPLCFDEENNFYIDYYRKKINELPDNPDLIIVSKMPDYHIFHFFTLCRLLKEKFKNAKIAIGGSWFSYIKDAIMKYPEIFDIFCDYVMVGNGEAAVVELAEYLNGERNIDEVSNMIYRKSDGQVYKNQYETKIDINKTAYADYDDYDFTKYCNDVPCASITLSKGCYWGKCNFCSYATANTKMQIKTIANAIKEIKYYIKKYNIRYFEITDDAIPPGYYSKLCDAIFENNLKIKINSFAIFDKRFTFELLQKMKKAGVNRLSLGFETNSEKIFKIVNKSGDFENRAEILQNIHKVGIITQVNFIEGFPREHFEDLLKTVKFIYDNVECIDQYAFFRFYLDVNCNFAKYPEKFGLKIISHEDFAFKCKYENLDTDITPENSFYVFRKNYILSNHEFNLKNYRTYGREELREVCTEYLKKFAPELL